MKIVCYNGITEETLCGGRGISVPLKTVFCNDAITYRCFGDLNRLLLLAAPSLLPRPVRPKLRISDGLKGSQRVLCI